MHLLERQQQLDTLNRCLQEARATAGKLVLIAAEAGVGKSALVEQFVAEHGRDAYTLWGACDALETPRALGPLYEMAAQTHSVGTVEQSRDRLFRTLFDEFARPERLCVAVLEDMHWADEGTLDFLRFIGRRIQRTRALMLVTYREEELPLTHPVRMALGELTGQHVIRMHLAPLSISAVADLTKETRWDAGVLHRITGGNPFFLREALAAQGEQVPGTVRDAVLSRLMRCSPPVRALAELLSMSPGRTAQWLVDSIIGARPDAIDEGIQRGLLMLQNDAISFRHELARMAVHSSVPPERARAVHRRLLQALVTRGTDLNAIVHHATLAEDAAALIKYAPAAAREAARLGAHRQAVAHLEAALPCSSALPAASRVALLELHAEECSVINQVEKAIASANQALDLWRQLADVEAQSRMLSFLANEYRTAGDKARADDCIALAIALLEPFPHSPHLAFAYRARARICSHRGLDREAVEYGQRALALARDLNDHETESHALNSIGSALLIASDPAGYEPLEQSLALALKHELQECVARSYSNLVFCCILEHELGRAERFLAEGTAYCEERALFSYATYMQAYASRLALERGDWSEAERIAAEQERRTELMPLHRVPTLTTLGLLRARRGDPGADQVLGKALDIALPMGEPERIGRTYAARAELAFCRGELERVAIEATKGLQHVRDLRFPWIQGELLWWLSRTQSVDPIPQDIATPYRLMIAGDWQAAAQAWENFGMPYEQALSLIAGPESALRESLVILDRLGAGPLAAIARRLLRERGVRSVPRGPNEATRSNPAGLTTKEVEILSLLVHGLTNAQLARRLHRSTKTIDHHISAILGKLGVHSRTEALAAALTQGLVTPPKESKRAT